jgi:hypothetical protein
MCKVGKIAFGSISAMYLVYETPFHLVTLQGTPMYVLPIYNQGCQMVCFQTKNSNLGKFLRALDWKMFIYFMATWNLGNVMAIWYILYSFGTFFRFEYHVPKKSGSPDFYIPHKMMWNPIFRWAALASHHDAFKGSTVLPVLVPERQVQQQSWGRTL